MIGDVLRYMPFGGRRFSPEIERIIRRRRLAAWIAAAVMVTIAIAEGAGPSYFYTAMLALFTVAAAFAGAQTIRLRRRGVTTAWFLDSWFRPIRPALIPRTRPFDPPIWPARLVILVIVLFGFVASLPNQVNAVAYLTGAAPTVSFVPQFQSRECAKGNPATCTTHTTGIRADTGTQAVYDGALAIGRTVQVRASPSWPLATSELLADHNAEGYTILGMFIDVILASVLSGYVLRWLVRGAPGLFWRPRRVPEEELVPLPSAARLVNGSTRNTARKKLKRLKKQRRKRLVTSESPGEYPVGCDWGPESFRLKC